MCRVLFYLRIIIKYGKCLISTMSFNLNMPRCFSWFDRLHSFTPSGVRGLRNYGLSCCVNTLLQAFSATWELADLLERWAPVGTGDGSRNIPLQLKKALMAMRSDQPQPAPHHNFLQCLDRNYIRLSIQHDADEVFLSILNFMQQQMDDKQLALEIQNLYKISVETHLHCSVCSSVQCWTSYLLNLPLHIREDRNSLEGCMTSFFQLQELKGRDCCFCAQCGSKTPSKQGFKLLSLPHILCVHVNRFRSYRGFTEKLDCAVTFPETFDLWENLGEEAFSKDYVKNDCKYVLFAVVVHSGSAMFGHYTAYVRHKGNHQWYFANDSYVEQATWKDVQRTYGGDYRDTAYMLMYRSTKEEEEQPQCSG
ncbi:ubl carboxyl-terminal hydrolase 18-like isoform X1 [Centroberyx affinis]|uniref:ubl carboxyl-terminal hydrolase 18-like isoform X1 n=1 Tax=Centroberyx affinis TaxID=166261 RepID=UPI003A5BEE23